MTSLHRVSHFVPTDRMDPVGFWNRVQHRVFWRKADGPKYYKQAADPATQGQETSSESSQAVHFRLRGDPSLPVISVSHNVSMYGYDATAMIVSPLFYQSIIHPDDTPRTMEVLAQMAMKGASRAHVNFACARSDGSYIWFECRYTPIRDEAGRLLETEGY